MRRMISKMQALGEKAAQVKKAIDAAPAHAAQLRQAIHMTAEQLHTVRDEVELAVHGLRAEGEAQISDALSELNEHALTLEEAGYEMVGVEMELSPVQRLIVKLEQFEEVPEPNLRLLISANNSRPTIKSLLTAISKANQIAAATELKYLTYRELIVHLGPMPTFRLAWRVVNEEPQPVIAAVPEKREAPPAEPAQSSIFAPRTEAPIRISAPVDLPQVAAPAIQAPKQPASASWQRSALDRFKQMPTESKYSP